MSSKRQYVHTFPHAWHARGQRFDPAILHFRKARNSMRITGFFVWWEQPRTFQILPGFGTEYDPFCTNLYQTTGHRHIAQSRADWFGEFRPSHAISVIGNIPK